MPLFGANELARAYFLLFLGASGGSVSKEKSIWESDVPIWRTRESLLRSDALPPGTAPWLLRGVRKDSLQEGRFMNWDGAMESFAERTASQELADQVAADKAADLFLKQELNEPIVGVPARKLMRSEAVSVLPRAHDASAGGGGLVDTLQQGGGSSTSAVTVPSSPPNSTRATNETGGNSTEAASLLALDGVHHAQTVEETKADSEESRIPRIRAARKVGDNFTGGAALLASDEVHDAHNVKEKKPVVSQMWNADEDHEVGSLQEDLHDYAS